MDTETAAAPAYALADPKALNVLVTREFQPELLGPMEAAYTLHKVYDAAARRQYLAEHGAKIEAVLTSGMVGLSADEMALMPNLKIVHTFAVGYEQVDTAAARAQGVMVCNTAGHNAACVAEHTIGMMIALTRRFVHFDARAKAGDWDDVNNAVPMMSGKRLGLVGLGHIGRTIAKRAEAFDMAVGYHTRRERADSGYRYFADKLALAEWADYVAVCTPGGPETRHLIDAELLARLGPKGYVVNVARGSVGDTDAIVAALTAGTIAGAALDVLESEPEVPEALRAAPNLLMTTHGAGRAPELESTRVELIRTNFENHFTGKPVLTPVPEMAD